jgi:hypothetical protein
VEIPSCPKKTDRKLIFKIAAWVHIDSVCVMIADKTIDSYEFSEIISDEVAEEIESEMIAQILDGLCMSGKSVSKDIHQQRMQDWRSTPLSKKLEYINFPEYINDRNLEFLRLYKV